MPLPILSQKNRGEAEGLDCVPGGPPVHKACFSHNLSNFLFETWLAGEASGIVWCLRPQNKHLERGTSSPFTPSRPHCKSEILMDPQSPQPSEATQPLPSPQKRNRVFKMRLTDAEANQLKSLAHARELSQAEFGRLMVLGHTAHSVPNAGKLEAIARQLAGIAGNLNQCQRAINSAQQSGALSQPQFAAMYQAITEGHKVWSAPLGELRQELKKLKPSS